MIHNLSDISLNDSQKLALAKAIMAGAIDKPVHVSLGSDQLATARDMLDELDIIHYSNRHNTIKINDEYLPFLVQSGIIDDSNQLTQEMNDLVSEPVVTESFYSFYFS